jgi:hypothetical protein
MDLKQTNELVRRADEAIARRDARALRKIIGTLRGHMSPRLVLLAIASAHALDAGDVKGALKFWHPFSEACRATAQSTWPV